MLDTLPPPANAVAAVTHADPYPYYGRLLRERPLAHHPELGLWVAASAEAVAGVLTHRAGRVRPLAEPVPTAIAGTPAGALFGELVRQNDGPRHCPWSRAVRATLDGVSPEALRAASRRAAHALSRDIVDGPAVTRFTFALSVAVITDLLGIGDWTPYLPRVDAYVRGVAPGASAHVVREGADSAAWLLVDFEHRVREGQLRDDGLLARLVEAGGGARPESVRALAANGAGFLIQAYEATAGLIGNTMLALARRSEARGARDRDRPAVAEVVAEVARHDPPVHNTRRFLAEEATIAGQTLPPGSSVLVVLAAANRDPALQEEPDRFLPGRRNRRSYTFGAGVHACPGEALATTIATAGVEALLEHGVNPEGLAEEFTYRPAPNTRIPVFGGVPLPGLRW